MCTNKVNRVNLDFMSILNVLYLTEKMREIEMQTKLDLLKNDQCFCATTLKTF